MAHKVRFGQQYDELSAFESAIARYQNAESVQFFKKSARSLNEAKGSVEQDFQPSYTELRSHPPLYSLPYRTARPSHTSSVVAGNYG